MPTVLLDFVELRSGTAPDLEDADDDLDFDVISNADEVRTGTDPRHVSAVGRYDSAYRYTLQTGAWLPGQTCTRFSVSNIRLAEVLPAVVPEGAPLGQGSTGRNRVLLVAGEVPHDDRNSFARYRVACVEAWVRREGNQRGPPSGRLTVEPLDFVELRDFVADVDCGGGHAP